MGVLVRASRVAAILWGASLHLGKAGLTLNRVAEVPWMKEEV